MWCRSGLVHWLAVRASGVIFRAFVLGGVPISCPSTSNTTALALYVKAGRGKRSARTVN